MLTGISVDEAIYAHLDTCSAGTVLKGVDPIEILLRDAYLYRPSVSHELRLSTFLHGLSDMTRSRHRPQTL